MTMNLVDKFDRLSEWISDSLGKPLAFAIALVSILMWALCGPMFHYSDTWQLLVNTSTTIMTFLMVFLLQNTQNRDTQATHALMRELCQNQALMLMNQRHMLESQRRLSERLRYLEYQMAKKVS